MLISPANRISKYIIQKKQEDCNFACVCVQANVLFKNCTLWKSVSVNLLPTKEKIVFDLWCWQGETWSCPTEFADEILTSFCPEEWPTFFPSGCWYPAGGSNCQLFHNIALNKVSAEIERGTGSQDGLSRLQILAGFDSFVVCSPHLREILNSKGQNNSLWKFDCRNTLLCYRAECFKSLSRQFFLKACWCVWLLRNVGLALHRAIAPKWFKLWRSLPLPWGKPSLHGPSLKGRDRLCSVGFSIRSTEALVTVGLNSIMGR